MKKNNNDIYSNKNKNSNINNANVDDEFAIC